jgi:hypothetical protein
MDMNGCVVVAVEKEKVTVFLENSRRASIVRGDRRFCKDGDIRLKVRNNCAAKREPDTVLIPVVCPADFLLDKIKIRIC